MNCPRCKTDMDLLSCTGGVIPTCTICRGSAITVALLRRFAPKERVDRAWRAARDGGTRSELKCPSCDGPMRLVEMADSPGELPLDACVHCHVIWFDPSELVAFSPERQTPATDDERRHVAERLGVVDREDRLLRAHPISDVAELFSRFAR